MAQPQHQYHPPPHYPPPPPPHSTPSPIPGATHPGAYHPPNKRPRLSQGQVTYAPPHMANGGLQGQAFSNPYLSMPPNGYPSRPQEVGQTTNPRPQTPVTAMGPPARPEDDKPLDLHELADVMVGSGVDLKAEEAALNYGGAFSRRATAGAGGSFTAPAGYFDHNTNTLSQNVPGGRDSFYGAGALNQPASAASPQTFEEEMEARRREAERKRAEREQYHLNNPFLHSRITMRRLTSACQDLHVTAPMEGVFTPRDNTAQRLIVAGPEGQERVMLLHGEPLATLTSPMVDILTLLSFAARDRIRTVIEDSVAIARGRRTTSHGIVPPDLLDVATGQGESMEADGLPMPRLGAGSPVDNPLKRARSEANATEGAADPSEHLLTPPSSNPARPQKTVAYPNLLAGALRRSLTADAAIEESRARKRQRRQTESIVSSHDVSRSVSLAATPGPSMPAGLALEVAPDRPITKKAAKRMADEVNQARQVVDTNSAVTNALGGLRKSWMTGGKPGLGGTNTGFGAKRPAGVGAPQKSSGGASGVTGTANGAGGNGAGAQRPKQLGDWREDREDGRGIQMRDVVAVMADAKEKKTLTRALGRLNRP